MTCQTIVLEVVSCVDEFRHFFEDTVLRVMGKPAFLVQQQELGLCLVLSEWCRERAREPVKREQAGHSIFRIYD